MFDFLSTKKTIDDARAKYRALMRELTELETEIQNTRFAPPAKADVIEAARRWAATPPAIDERLAHRLGQAMAGTGTGPDNVRRVGLARLFADQNGYISADDVDTLLRLVAGDAVARVLEDAIGRNEYAEAYGLPVAQRAKKLAKLEGDHQALKAKIVQLVKDCDEAGIDLS